MEKEDTISVQWAQGDVETSYSLLNNNNNIINCTNNLRVKIHKHNFSAVEFRSIAGSFGNNGESSIPPNTWYISEWEMKYKSE